MNCPACKEALIVLELDEVEIDHCFSCKGIWLDEGELELLLEEATAAEAFLATFEADIETREKSRKCPICVKRMEKVLYGGDTKVRVDKCRRNHGIWFDKGELQDIISQASGAEDNKVLKLLKDMFGGPKKENQGQQT